MVYKLVNLPKALEEIEKAFEYDHQISDAVLINFDKQLEEVF